MLLYTCQSCRRGEHKFCAGRKAPPPGMIGGSECDCDGKCGGRLQTPDSDPAIKKIEAALQLAQEQVGESDE